MHLLRIDTVSLDEGEAAEDLCQEPGEIVVLSFTDSDLHAAASAYRAETGLPALRLARLARLRHPMSVDLYVDAVISRARIVVIRCLGGLDYWRYGIERCAAAARAKGVALAVLPGDDRPDERLDAFSTAPPELCAALDAYFRAGGIDNLRQMLRRLAKEIGGSFEVAPPRVLPRGFAWESSSGEVPLETALAATSTHPLALLLVYRSTVLSGDTAPIAALSAALRERGIGTLTLAVSSLRDPEALALLRQALAARHPDVIVAATAFSAREDATFVLDAADCPVLQAYTISASRVAWEASSRGMNAADLAMQVALPEFDGRLAGFPIAFKEEGALVNGFAERRAVPDTAGIAALTERAAAWIRLARLPRARRRVAMVLSDYPARGGRAGYAVGLDTPDSARAIVSDLAAAGYATGALPDSATLMGTLTKGDPGFAVPLAEYRTWFETLPVDARDTLVAHWGPPETDPKCIDGAFRFRMIDTSSPPASNLTDRDGAIAAINSPPPCGEGSWVPSFFSPRSSHPSPHPEAPASAGVEGSLQELPAGLEASYEVPLPLEFQDQDRGISDGAVGIVSPGRLAVFLQPDRGRAADRKMGYHDPDEPPAHAYLAFYLGLRRRFDALIHLGTHGTTEWLPGKAVALSLECWPARAIGALPVIYPFIVDDPGEAAPAKRRLSAITLGHLTPLVEAGGLSPEAAALRGLVEEYSAASVLDPRRAGLIAQAILEEADSLGLLQGAGLDADTPIADALTALDAHLCDLAETPFRDGLHVFGRVASPCELDPSHQCPHPEVAAFASLEGGLQEALAELEESASSCLDGVIRSDKARSGECSSKRHDAAATLSPAPCRKELEVGVTLPASFKPSGTTPTLYPSPQGRGKQVVSPSLHLRAACAEAERDALIAALDGRFVPPGPAGSPSRGRLDVMPTGRNLTTLDPRSLPTRAATLLGARAAEAVVRRYLQDEGEYPARIVMDLWASPTLRTGGEDVAHALSLMGVRPVWDHASTRVIGCEVLPLALLDRPRIDVTCRVSGAFRDTFPETLGLLDQAARAVAALEEENADNPLAAARRRGESATRIYGAAPGRYGAGAGERALDGAWVTRNDLGEAYLAASTHAFGQLEAETSGFADRVARADAYVHAFDVAERDLLDGDAAADAMGGFSAAAARAGASPALYCLDVSKPENPRLRSAREDVARLIGGRLANPRWIAAQLRHGYRGVQELAQGADAVFILAATTNAVSHADLDRLHAAWIGDLDIFERLRAANPEATRAILERFDALRARGLWTSRRNGAPAEVLMRGAAE